MQTQQTIAPAISAGSAASAPSALATDAAKKVGGGDWEGGGYNNAMNMATMVLAALVGIILLFGILYVMFWYYACTEISTCAMLGIFVAFIVMIGAFWVASRAYQERRAAQITVMNVVVQDAVARANGNMAPEGSVANTVAMSAPGSVFTAPLSPAPVSMPPTSPMSMAMSPGAASQLGGGAPTSAPLNMGGLGGHSSISRNPAAPVAGAAKRPTRTGF